MNLPKEFFEGIKQLAHEAIKQKLSEYLTQYIYSYYIEFLESEVIQYMGGKENWDKNKKEFLLKFSEWMKENADRDITERVTCS